jgi:chloramphenicol-sensitive protein RarD
MSTPSAPPENKDTLPGFVYAMAAYVIWGFLPLFMKAVAHIPPTEVIAHRVIWSVPIAAAVLLWQGRTADLARALRTPAMLAMAGVTAALVSVNWLIYVWAIGAGHALDAALGYYINPLFSVLIGFVVLKEKMSRLQAMAIGLAVLAVALLTYEAGRLPLVALGLSLTWGAYAYFKKSLPIGPNQGFLLEVLLLTPFGLAYVIWLASSGAGHFAAGVALDTALLAATGVVTAVPLMLYANGAKLLRLSTIAVMQYTSPTMIFLTAVFLFDEPFGSVKLAAFCMIWTALALYSYSFFAQRRAG